MKTTLFSLLFSSFALADTRPIPWPWTDSHGLTGQCVVSLGPANDPDFGWYSFSNLTGTASNSQLASNYSGVGACSSNQWVSGANTNAAPTCAQPAFSNISGAASAAQLPAPSASARGGVSGTGSSLTCPAGQFARGFDAAGAMLCAAPTAQTLSASVSNPSRALNTNFTPSATNVVWGVYTISFSCSISLTAGQASTVELRADTNVTPTTNRGTSATGNTGTLTIGLALVNSNTLQLSAFFPPAWNGRLVSTGTCTVTSVLATETSLAI